MKGSTTQKYRRKKPGGWMLNPSCEVLEFIKRNNSWGIWKQFFYIYYAFMSATLGSCGYFGSPYFLKDVDKLEKMGKE